MNGTKKLSLGFGSVLALVAANVLLFAMGPQGAVAGEGCEEECWCFGDVCNEEEIAFEECIPGWSEAGGEGTGWVLDQTIDPVTGEPTGESCGGGN